MNSLNNITKLVKRLLETEPQTRNSDNLLYLKVLEAVGSANGHNIHSLTIPTFLMNARYFGFPPFESVRRTRQKIQAQFPELAASEAVEVMRSENEKAYRDYARAVVE